MAARGSKKIKRRNKPRDGRNIITVYYDGDNIVKTNRAKYSHTAVLKCVDHMQFNHYDATSAEVYDDDDGVLHAVVVATLVAGKAEIRIIFKREIQKEQE